MSIRAFGLAGVCVLALCVAAEGAPKRAKPAGKCAEPVEMTAQQTSAIQQELMDAALTCGDKAQTNYNTFQTRFSAELRAFDQAMLRMFARVMGAKAGDKAYNLFKTELASKAEHRRTLNHTEFCNGANLMAAAALGPTNMRLADFVSEAPERDLAGGVNGCVIAAPSVVPKPNPLRLAAFAPAGASVSPPLSSASAVPAPASPPASQK